MATSKSGGSTSNGRESQSKRLGLKRSDGQYVNCGEILVRQRGTKFHPGLGVKRGKDDTLYAIRSGNVKFKSGLKRRKYVCVFTDSSVTD